MSTEIYYFSGTGNSLYMAKELQERLPEVSLIPMVSLLHKDIIEAHGETVGFVFPVHLMTLPGVVRRFLEKLDLRSTRYVFAVVTQGGTPAVADIHIRDILKKKGRGLDASFVVKMPWNSPIGLMPVYIPGMIHYPPEPERILKLTTDARNKLESICRIVANREPDPEDDSPRHLRLFLKQVYFNLMVSNDKSQDKTLVPYYADEDCTGCGVCERVCVSERIKMVGGEPVWQEGVPCFHCYACFAFCPVQSILVRGRYDKKDGRYSHPEITSSDITGQSSAETR